MAQLSKQALLVENQTNFPDNNTGYITPSLLRGFNIDSIDSTVNQTVYNSDSGSWNISIGALNTFTQSQQPSFTNLNAFTASQLIVNTNLNAFTQSAGASITNLNAYTASHTGSVSVYDEGVLVSNNINAFNFTGNGITASYVSGKAVVSVDFSSLNSFTQSQNVVNTQLNSYTSSQDVRNATLAVVTSSLNSATQSLQNTTSSLNAFTQSAGNSINLLNAFTQSFSTGCQVTSASFNAYTASTNIRLNNIETTTASLNTSVNNINTFTASAQTSITNLNIHSASVNTFTASAQVSINNLNTTTASLNTSVSNLNSATSSLFTSASNALVTGSIAGQILQFKKGDNSTFNLTLPTGSQSIVTGSYAQFYDITTQSGSANTPYALKFPLTAVPDGVILSGSTGMQVGAAGVYNIQFSLQVSQGAGAANLNVWFKKNGVNIDNSDTSWTVPSNQKLVPVVNILDQAALNDVYEIWWISDSANTTFLSAAATANTPAIPSVITTIYRVDVGGGTNVVTTGSFNAYTASVNTSITNLNIHSASVNTTTASINTSISNLNIATASLNTTTASLNTSVSNINVFTASAQTSITKLNQATGSYATTGSNTFIGNQIIQDNALYVLGQNPAITLAANVNSSGSQYPNLGVIVDPALYPTDIYGGFGVYQNSAYTPTTLISMAANSYTKYYPETVAGIFGGAANNNGSDAAIIWRTGSALMEFEKESQFNYKVSISGSLNLTGSAYGNVVSMSITSNTASMDLSKGNYFELTSSVTPLRINFTNIKPGVSSTLIISASASSSIILGSGAQQPSGSAYSGSAGSIDILSFVAFNTSKLNVVATKAMI